MPFALLALGYLLGSVVAEAAGIWFPTLLAAFGAVEWLLWALLVGLVALRRDDDLLAAGLLVGLLSCASMIAIRALELVVEQQSVGPALFMIATASLQVALNVVPITLGAIAIIWMLRTIAKVGRSMANSRDSAA